MRSATHRTRSLAVALAFAVAVLAVSLALPGLAAAHSFLTSSDPARDAVLPALPQRITATFNEELQSLFPAMTVIGPDAETGQWQEGDAAVSGAKLSVAVKPGAPAGRYTVNYRVTSADGHPVSGSWSFTVTGTGAPATLAPGVVTSSSTVSPSAAEQQPASHGAGALPTWPFMVAAVLAVGVALLWSQRRSS